MTTDEDAMERDDGGDDGEDEMPTCSGVAGDEGLLYKKHVY